MRKETKKKVRILGAVLFFLYLLALTYFLFFAEGYGRSVEGRMYAYNLQPFEFSLCVETIQLVWKVGSFDVDDLILNTLGGVIGYLLFWICNKIRRKIYG